LNELWEGITISTYEATNKNVQAAVICYACDIPAARKLCGHISFRIACHRCEKLATFDSMGQPNFSGFGNMEQWFVTRDIEKIRNDALLWKSCNSEEARRKHVSETLVRWSEMHRLPYFDAVQFLIVDPMHCLFLGIAKWIVTRLWINDGKGKLSLKDIETMQSRVNTIKIPSDIGRIPSKIEGFSGFTADQWKTFILIYATTITWDLLDNADKEILSYFVRACNILVCRIVSKSGLKEAHRLLLSMVKLVEQHYGPETISPNMHLCLHICECVYDYSPTHSFWCYSFERMNGLLGNIIQIKNSRYFYIIFAILNIFLFTGSFHSSNRHIEPEMIRTVQHYSILDELSLQIDDQGQHLSKTLPFVAFKENVGSLTDHNDSDQNDLDLMEFLKMSKNVKEKAGTGSEPFPGEFLKPTKSNVKLPPDILSLLVKYYENAYNCPFESLSKIHLSMGSTVVLPNVDKFARLRLGAEIFGSEFSKRYINSANILARFVLDDDTIDTYSGQVQFFFEHKIQLPDMDQPVTHSLAFVRWYQATDDRRTRFQCEVDKNNAKICNVELWKGSFYELSRDCIIPVHNILGRFVAGKMTIGRKKPKECLAVIPINRKFHM
jgi:hypothetical protein